MSIKCVFDLDGTIFDLYNRPNWLSMLENEQEEVFAEYGDNNGWLSYINRISFNEAVTALMMEFGVEFEVITWLPMQASPEYEERCRQKKTEWVKKNLPFVSAINCVSYGLPKQNFIKKRAQRMILFDDNKEVCEMWETNKQRIAIQVSENNPVDKMLNELLCELEAEYIE